MSENSVVIVGAKRTAIGSLLGQFTGVATPQLGATAIRAALAEAGVAGDQVDEVLMDHPAVAQVVTFGIRTARCCPA